MIKLSVVIPVYNVEQFLVRCVESVLNQDLEDEEFEVLLINDGSTDKSDEIGKQLAAQYSQIHYFEQENKGLGAARNLGIRNSNGKYILFLDSDDWIETKVLKNLLTKAEQDNLDMLIYNSRRVFENGENKNIEVTYLPNHLYTGENLILETRVDVLPCANFYRKSILIENIISFEEGVFYEDPDFYFKFILNSERIMYVPEMVYNYYFNENSITLKTEKNHINKKIKDYGLAGLRIFDLKKNQTQPIEKKLDFLFEKYQLWLMRMIYRENPDFSVVENIIKQYQKKGAFPFEIQQQFLNHEDKTQLFYFNRFMLKPFFFKTRFRNALLLMKINKRLKIF